MKTPARHLLGLAAATLLATNAQGATLLFNDFSDVSGLTLNGSASQVGNALRLTPANFGQSGSAFSTTPVSLALDASFSSAFEFQITGRGGLGNGADGLTFTVQTQSNNVGGLGGGLGYQGIANSVAVEFDTFNNGEFGGSNHVGIDLNGSTASVVSTGFLSPDFDNGSVWSAWVDYDGATDLLEVRFAEGSMASRPVASMLSHTVDLVSVLSTTDAFIGFTSGTGSGFGNHDILAWQFNNDFDPIDNIGVPAPGTLLLLAAGLLGAAVYPRSRGKMR